MINEEENNPSYNQTPNFSPSPLKSNISRLRSRSKGNATPETALSKQKLETEMKILEDRLVEKSKFSIARETEKLRTEVSEFMLEIVREFKKLKSSNSQSSATSDEVGYLVEEIQDLRNENANFFKHVRLLNKT